MCRVLKVTRQGYYAWVKRPISVHDERDLELAQIIIPLWEKLNSCYGAMKMHEELKARGITTSKKRVARIMREYDLVGTCGIGMKLLKPKQKPQVNERDNAEDLVKRKFSAEGPNQAWFADITYVKTYQGWLYVAIVMDIWSRMIIGWSMDKHMDAVLVDDALRMALAKRQPKSSLIHHSDHGSQYRSLLLGKTMREHDITPSMGAISSPWDNAPTESFMGIIKRECVHRKIFETREHAQLEIFEYIETFYNRVRRHSALGFVSPADYEAKMLGEKSSEDVA